VQQQYRHLVPSPQPPLPKAKQFAIAIARLEEDPNDDLRDLLVEGLRGVPGVQVLRFDRTSGLHVAGNPREEEFRIQRQAQGWLQQSQADLLIWGQVLPAVAGKERMVRLFFTGRDTDHQETLRLEAGQAIELPVAAREPLEAVVRAQVLTRLGGFSASQPVARALRTEIDRLQAMVRDWLPGRTRALLHRALGDAWATVGNQMGESSSLELAVQAYQEALVGMPRASAPLDWAEMQNKLGNALWRLGERERGTTRLEEAVAAYRLALEERTRDRVPLDWAMTQNNLGAALQRLGERERGTTRLEEAVAAYRLALEEWTRDRVPLYWAMTQNNLGVALQILGERESGTTRLEEAVEAYRLALEERTRDRVPLDWALTQNNLGSALRSLGERESGTTRLEAAVAAYRLALEEFKAGHAEYYVEKTQRSLEQVLELITKRASQR
jgi:tetratricopeptide (TPR) repeat protein